MPPPAPAYEKVAAYATDNGWERRVVHLRPSTVPNTVATRVDGTFNSADAPWHLVSADRVLFCLPDDVVRES